MSKTGRSGSDDELFDTGWIDEMVGDATARIDSRLPVVPSTDPALASRPAPPPDQHAPTGAADLLAEVSWVDAPSAQAPAVQPTHVQPPAVRPAPVQPAPAQQQAPAVQPTAVQPTAVQPTAVQPTAVQQHLVHASPARGVPSQSPGPMHVRAGGGQAVTTAEVEQLNWRDLDNARGDAPQSIDARQQMSTSPHSPSRSSARRSGPSGAIREWAPVVLGALLVALLLRTFVVQAFEIPSESMLPTLETDDRIVVNQLSYSFGDVQRGEVIVFERPPAMRGVEGEADYLVKRVVGIPGDEVQLFEGNVWVNSQRLVEPYVFEEARTGPTNVVIPGCEGGGTADSCVVPEGFVFVLGDNRSNSTDSRVVGPIDSDLIVGRAVLRAWPLTAPRWL